MEENKEQPMPCKTPISDLRRMALEHYEKASISIHNCMLVIPTAINEYYDRLEQVSITNIGTPVQDNSFAFTDWLDNKKIEYKRSGHQTIILGQVDMFNLHQEWAEYKNSRVK